MSQTVTAVFALPKFSKHISLSALMYLEGDMALTFVISITYRSLIYQSLIDFIQHILC